MNSTIVNFSETYAEARERFLGGVAAYGIAVASEPHPEHRGAAGETLAIDAALLGDPAAPSLFILTSGTHGAEGFCGSACQTMLIHDVILRRRIEDKRVAVLLVHAVNPWGFSHLSRTNEDGIDLNRNFMDFGKPLPENPVYEAAHALLVPDTWPPTEAHEARVRSMMDNATPDERRRLSGGQYNRPDGLFHGGRASSWSNRTIRALLRRHVANRSRVAWIDLHTGLGPYGHGEKIFGRYDATITGRARSWWGMDLVPSSEPGSVSPIAAGYMTLSIDEECPGVEVTRMTLEYGTLPSPEVRLALRGEAWLRAHPDAPAPLAAAIRRSVRDAFYVDRDDWKGMILGQFRSIALQTINGLGDSP